MSYIINESANLLRVCRSWAILWSRHKSRSHIITEHIGTVVKTSVQNAQVKVLSKINYQKNWGKEEKKDLHLQVKK